MEIKEKAAEILEKIKGDENLLANFKDDPIKAVTDLIGVDVNTDEIKSIAKAAVEKFNLDADGDGKIDFLEKLDADGDGTPDILEKLGGVGDIIGGLFKK